MERVADREMPGVDEADDVARVGDVDRLAVAAEEPVRARRPERLPQPAVGHHHVLREAAGAHADERDAIAMARIHVRLDLEHKAGEALVGRVHDPRIARARLRRRREVDERLEERLEAEVRQGAAEEHGRLPTRAIFRDVERRAGLPDHIQRLAEMRVDLARRVISRASGSSSDEMSTGARYCPCASRS